MHYDKHAEQIKSNGKETTKTGENPFKDSATKKKEREIQSFLLCLGCSAEKKEGKGKEKKGKIWIGREGRRSVSRPCPYEEGDEQGTEI